MAKSHPERKRPSDPIQLAKLAGDITTGQIQDQQKLKHPTADEIRRVMSALGKIGGPKGGIARKESLSARRRSQIAKNAAAARWNKK